VEVFVVETVRATELITILNHCHHFRGFVYQHARFGPDQNTIEVAIRPREGSTTVCSGCHKPAPGYDHLPERRFEFIPFWGLPWMGGAPQLGLSTFMRRINWRISSLTFGRPGRRSRERHRQNSRNPARCQETTVSGFTIIRASAQPGHIRSSATQKTRSR
jgi:hypothetical protein